MYRTWLSSHIFLVHMTAPCSYLTHDYHYSFLLELTTIPNFDHHDTITIGQTPITYYYYQGSDITMHHETITVPKRKCLDQYLSSCHIWTKSIKGFGNNAVNLQHENSKSVTKAFRPGYGRGTLDPYLATYHTVMIPSFRTDMPRQTVQTQIRLLLEEQSDQGLQCLPFRLHRLDSLLYGRAP